MSLLTGKRETVSILRACEILDVSRRTIYNWLKDGKITAVRTAGGSVRIYTDTLYTDFKQNNRKETNGRIS